MKQDETYKRIVRNDKRYDKIFDQMELLGIKDVSTPRQCKNGTVVWRLPIKYSTHPRFIEVASFATGYVRNQNGGYTNYQLNKRCESEPQYYPVFEWCDKAGEHIKTDKFRQYTTRSCVLIPNEIDRLEYLIGYCLKNYYIKKANEVINGRYVEQWYHDQQIERVTSNKVRELQDRVYELESQVNAGDDRVIDLKAQLHMSQGELSSTKVRQDVSVIVNGHRYKVL